MTTLRSLMLGLLALLLPGIAHATDMSLSFAAFTEYDSNVFRRDFRVEDDVLFRLVPGLKIHQDRGEDFNYSLAYRAPVELFVENGSQLNDVDQFLDAEFLYDVGKRLDLYLRNDFRYLRNSLRTQTTLDSVGLPVVSTGRARVTVNDLTAGGRYLVKPRIDAGLELGYRLFEITRIDRQDSNSINATTDLSYLLNERQRIGGGIAYGRQDFNESINLVGSFSNIFYAFARWRYVVGETLRVELEVGPSYISVNQDDPTSRTLPTIPSIDDPEVDSGVLAAALSSCLSLQGVSVFGDCRFDQPFSRSYIDSFGDTPVTTAGTVGSRYDSTVDVFARVNITKQWTPGVATSLRFSRAPGVASGLGGTVIRNALTAAGDWEIAARWKLFVRGDWVTRRSVTSANQIVGVAEDGAVATGDPLLADIAATQGTRFGRTLGTNRIKSQLFSIVGRLTYRILRNTEASLQLRYDDQDSEANTLGQASDFRVWTATIGVRHLFDPIKLWK